MERLYFWRTVQQLFTEARVIWLRPVEGIQHRHKQHKGKFVLFQNQEFGWKCLMNMDNFDDDADYRKNCAWSLRFWGIHDD